MVLPAELDEHLASFISFTESKRSYHFICAFFNHDAVEISNDYGIVQYQLVLHLSSQTIYHYNKCFNNTIPQNYCNTIFSFNSNSVGHYEYFVFSRPPHFTQNQPFSSHLSIYEVTLSSPPACRNNLTFHVPMLKLISLLEILLEAHPTRRSDRGTSLSQENPSKNSLNPFRKNNNNNNVVVFPIPFHIFMPFSNFLTHPPSRTVYEVIISRITICCWLNVA